MSGTSYTITVSQAAERLGVTPQAVRLRCQQHNLGQMITPRLRLLSEANLRKLRQLIPENPENRPGPKRE
jgi:hypothetical protein